MHSTQRYWITNDPVRLLTWGLGVLLGGYTAINNLVLTRGGTGGEASLVGDSIGFRLIRSLIY
jgi:hypothetical protein